MKGNQKLKNWIIGSLKSIELFGFENREFEITYKQLFERDLNDFIININEAFNIFKNIDYDEHYFFCLVLEVLQTDKNINIGNSLEILNNSDIDLLNSSFNLIDKNNLEFIINHGNLIQNISWVNKKHKVYVLSNYNEVFQEKYTHLYVLIE